MRHVLQSDVVRRTTMGNDSLDDLIVDTTRQARELDPDVMGVFLWCDGYGHWWARAEGRRRNFLAGPWNSAIEAVEALHHKVEGQARSEDIARQLGGITHDDLDAIYESGRVRRAG
jgi:hypothetical protein